MQTKLSGGLRGTVTVANALKNYIKHRKIEKKAPFTDYINDQDDLTKWKLGFEKFANCGCEVVAVYNVRRALGKTIGLSELILMFELSGYVMLYGFFGTDPTKLGVFFTLAGILYGQTSDVNLLEKKAKKGNPIIFSCWNGGITGGLHTFMVEYDATDKSFKSHNGYNNDNYGRGYKKLKDILKGRGGFIVGYYFPK